MDHPSIPVDARDAAGSGDLIAAPEEDWRYPLLLLVVLALTPWMVIAALIRIGLRLL
jgi:hypothetical protein